MTVGEHIKELVTAESYLNKRLTVSDEFIDFVRENMPSQYNLFKEKEEAFKKLEKFFNQNNLL